MVNKQGANKRGRMEKMKIPERMCCVCRGRFEKTNLVRVVKNKNGDIFVDETFKAAGRGAYVCKSKECFEKAVKQRQLERALETRIEEAVFTQLMEEIDAS